MATFRCCTLMLAYVVTLACALEVNGSKEEISLEQKNHKHDLSYGSLFHHQKTMKVPCPGSCPLRTRWESQEINVDGQHISATLCPTHSNNLYLKAVTCQCRPVLLSSGSTCEFLHSFLVIAGLLVFLKNTESSNKGFDVQFHLTVIIFLFLSAKAEQIVFQRTEPANSSVCVGQQLAFSCTTVSTGSLEWQITGRALILVTNSDMINSTQSQGPFTFQLIIVAEMGARLISTAIATMADLSLEGLNMTCGNGVNVSSLNMDIADQPENCLNVLAVCDVIPSTVDESEVYLQIQLSTESQFMCAVGYLVQFNGENKTVAFGSPSINFTIDSERKEYSMEGQIYIRDNASRVGQSPCSFSVSGPSAVMNVTIQDYGTDYVLIVWMPSVITGCLKNDTRLEYWVEFPFGDGTLVNVVSDSSTKLPFICALQATDLAITITPVLSDLQLTGTSLSTTLTLEVAKCLMQISSPTPTPTPSGSPEGDDNSGLGISLGVPLGIVLTIFVAVVAVVVIICVLLKHRKSKDSRVSVALSHLRSESGDYSYGLRSRTYSAPVILMPRVEGSVPLEETRSTQLGMDNTNMQQMSLGMVKKKKPLQVFTRAPGVIKERSEQRKELEYMYSLEQSVEHILVQRAQLIERLEASRSETANLKHQLKKETMEDCMEVQTEVDQSMSSEQNSEGNPDNDFYSSAAEQESVKAFRGFDQGRLAIEDLKQVKDALGYFSAWKNLGLNLGLHPILLEVISKDNRNVNDRLVEVLRNWLLTNYSLEHEVPTWRQLAAALEPIDCALSQNIRHSHHGDFDAFVKDRAEQSSTGPVVVTTPRKD